MSGLLNALPPGLRGYQAQRQFDMQEDRQQLGQVTGLLNMRNAVMQQQQAQKDQELKGLLGQKLAAGDQEGAKSLLMQYKPELFAQSMLPQKPDAPYTLAPGAVRYDANNRPIASAPTAPKVEPRTQVERMMSAAGIDPASPQGKQYLQNALMKATTNAPPVAVSVNNTSENSYAKALGGKSAEADLTQYDNAQLAADSLGKIDMVIDQLQNGDVITGIGADVFKNVERIKALVTQSAAAGKKVSDTELMDSLLGSDVFPMIKALGIGARGLDTPAEREFLRQVMTGTINMNKDTLIRMAKIRKDVSERAVNRWNERVDRGEVDRFFSQTGRRKEKFQLPAGQSSSNIDSLLDKYK